MFHTNEVFATQPWIKLISSMKNKREEKKPGGVFEKFFLRMKVPGELLKKYSGKLSEIRWKMLKKVNFQSDDF